MPVIDHIEVAPGSLPFLEDDYGKIRIYIVTDETINDNSEHVIVYSPDSIDYLAKKLNKGESVKFKQLVDPDGRPLPPVDRRIVDKRMDRLGQSNRYLFQQSELVKT